MIIQKIKEIYKNIIDLYPSYLGAPMLLFLSLFHLYEVPQCVDPELHQKASILVQYIKSKEFDVYNTNDPEIIKRYFEVMRNSIVNDLKKINNPIELKQYAWVIKQMAFSAQNLAYELKRTAEWSSEAKMEILLNHIRKMHQRQTEMYIGRNRAIGYTIVLKSKYAGFPHDKC